MQFVYTETYNIFRFINLLIFFLNYHANGRWVNSLFVTFLFRMIKLHAVVA